MIRRISSAAVGLALVLPNLGNAQALTSEAPWLPSTRKVANTTSQYFNLPAPGKVQMDLLASSTSWSGKEQMSVFGLYVNTDESFKMTETVRTMGAMGQYAWSLDQNNQLTAGVKATYSEAERENVMQFQLFPGQTTNYRVTDSATGMDDIKMHAALSTKLASNVAAASSFVALKASMSPMPHKSKADNGDISSESNRFSGGQTLGAAVGAEVKVKSGILGAMLDGTVKGERLSWIDQRDSTGQAVQYDGMTTGGHTSSANIFGEFVPSNKARVGMTAGVTAVAEENVHLVQTTRAGSSNWDRKPRQYNHAALYAAFLIDDNVDVRPSMSYRELNDPRHFKAEFLEETSINLSVTSNF